MLKKIFFLSLLFFMSFDSADEVLIADRTVSRIISEFSREMKKKNLYQIGITLGLDHDIQKHKLIGIVYQTTERIETMEQGRKIIVNTIRDFINFINNRKDIQQYLAVTPFKIENIQIGILPVNPGISEIDCMFNNGQRLVYSVQGVDNNCLSSLKHEETYDEAVKILESNSNEEKSSGSPPR